MPGTCHSCGVSQIPNEARSRRPSLLLFFTDEAIPTDKSPHFSKLIPCHTSFATADSSSFLLWPVEVDARALGVPVGRTPAGMMSDSDFPEFAQAVRHGVPGTLKAARHGVPETLYSIDTGSFKDRPSASDAKPDGYEPGRPESRAAQLRPTLSGYLLSQSGSSSDDSSWVSDLRLRDGEPLLFLFD